jgi:renalase
MIPCLFATGSRLCLSSNCLDAELELGRITKRAVAVIGAGIAGLAATQEFANAGLAVTVFEKCAGLGGQMTTRHTSTRTFDHSAQYFTALAPEFAALVSQWTASG